MTFIPNRLSMFELTWLIIDIQKEALATEAMEMESEAKS